MTNLVLKASREAFRTYILLLIIFLGFLPWIFTTEYLHPDPMTFVNLMFLTVLLFVGLIKAIQLAFGPRAFDSRLNLTDSQYEKVARWASVVTKHKVTGALFIGVVFAPLFVLVILVGDWINSFGLPSDVVTGFLLVMMVMSIIFIPAGIIGGLYDAAVHPSRISVSKLQWLIDTFHPNRTWSPERLESASKRTVVKPNKVALKVTAVTVAISMALLEIAGYAMSYHFLPFQVASALEVIAVLVAMSSLFLMSIGRRVPFLTYILERDESQ